MNDLQAELDRLMGQLDDPPMTEFNRRLKIYLLAAFILDHRDQVVMMVKPQGLEWVEWMDNGFKARVGDASILIAQMGSGKWWWNIHHGGRAVEGLVETEAEAKAAAEQWVKDHEAQP